MSSHWSYCWINSITVGSSNPELAVHWLAAQDKIVHIDYPIMLILPTITTKALVLKTKRHQIFGLHYRHDLEKLLHLRARYVIIVQANEESMGAQLMCQLWLWQVEKVPCGVAVKNPNKFQKHSNTWNKIWNWKWHWIPIHVDTTVSM